MQDMRMISQPLRSLRACAAVAGLAAALLCPVPPALAGEPEIREITDSVDSAAGLKRDFIVAPIPLSSPATGKGLAVAAAMLYEPKGSERPWITGISGLYTHTKSWGIGAAQTANFDHDRYRVAAAAGYGDFNLEFFGIGPDAGARGISADIEDKGLFGFFQGMMRIVPNLYFGPVYRYLDIDAALDPEDPLLPDMNLPPLELHSRVSSLGFVLQYDSRDAEFGPRNGVFAQLHWLRAIGALGSDFEYSKLTLEANLYHALGPGTVIAGRFSLCSVGDHAPFYDLCMFGVRNDLRGYMAGQYRDQTMYAVQVELRQHLFWRIGGVVFAGVGGVAPTLGKLLDERALPAAGLGLRFQVSKTYNVNFAIDYAWGRDSHALYFSVGDSF
jgi:hypothetical protein